MSVFQVGEPFIPYMHFREFAPIPRVLMCYEGLTPIQKLMWGRLAQYAGKDGKCTPSTVSLARELGISQRWARQALQGLEKKGFLRLDFRTGQTTDIKFLYHEVFIGAGRNDSSPPPRNDPSSPPVGYILPPRNDPSSKKNSLKEERRETSFSHSLPKEIREKLGLPGKVASNEAEEERHRLKVLEQIELVTSWK